MNSLAKINMPTIKNIITNTAGSMFFLGGGLCYALEEKKYIHIPVVFLFPSIYCGYNMYKNRNAIINFYMKQFI